MSENSSVDPALLDGSGVRIGVVQSRFNPDITDALWAACCGKLLSLGVENQDILHVAVPGAMEIPIVLRRMAQTADFDVLIALGAVVKGGTYHFEIVCNESARGIAEVAREYDLPVVNMVLTTYTEDQALERIETKGVEAAKCAVEMANVMFGLEEGFSGLFEEDGGDE